MTSLQGAAWVACCGIGHLAGIDASQVVQVLHRVKLWLRAGFDGVVQLLGVQQGVTAGDGGQGQFQKGFQGRSEALEAGSRR